MNSAPGTAFSAPGGAPEIPLSGHNLYIFVDVAAVEIPQDPVKRNPLVHIIGSYCGLCGKKNRQQLKMSSRVLRKLQNDPEVKGQDEDLDEEEDDDLGARPRRRHRNPFQLLNAEEGGNAGDSASEESEMKEDDGISESNPRLKRDDTKKRRKKRMKKKGSKGNVLAPKSSENELDEIDKSLQEVDRLLGPSAVQQHHHHHKEKKQMVGYAWALHRVSLNCPVHCTVLRIFYPTLICSKITSQYIIHHQVATLSDILEQYSRLRL